MPGEDPIKDLELFSTFREETSCGVGDPYQPANPIPERYKGKQFSVPVQPSGTGRDAMIDKTTLLRLPGDKYVDPFNIDKILGKELGTPISDNPFKPTNPSAKSSGAGSTYGLLSPPILDTAPSVAAQTSTLEKSRAPGKRNIYVNPPKNGSFGFPWHDRTIGQTKLEYMPDEYAPGQKLDRALKAAARAKIPKPFVSMGRTGNGIKPISNYNAGPDDTSVRRSSSASMPKAVHTKQWKPCNPPQKGPGHGCINKLEYVSCPTVTPPKPHFPKGFVPSGIVHNRLSMRAVNPYAYEARQQPDNDFTLLS